MSTLAKHNANHSPWPEEKMVRGPWYVDPSVNSDTDLDKVTMPDPFRLVEPAVQSRETQPRGWDQYG